MINLKTIKPSLTQASVGCYIKKTTNQVVKEDKLLLAQVFFSKFCKLNYIILWFIFVINYYTKSLIFFLFQQHVCFEIEEGYGETDPYVSTLFDEIWYVEDVGDCCSRISSKFKTKEDDNDDYGEEVDSFACKRRKTKPGSAHCHLGKIY